MDKPTTSTQQLPDGRLLIYTTDPNTILIHTPTAPYGATGVVNRAWLEAAGAVGRRYTQRETKAGWPEAIELHRLACLQHLQDPAGQNYIHTALQAACAAGKVPCITYTQVDNDGATGQPAVRYTERAITAQDFAVWLALQGEDPSAHIAAWFTANGVATPAAAPPASASGKRDMRRTVLSPVIEAAQRECQDPFDTPAVWAALMKMAGAEKRPLLGACEDGIKWLDASDNIKFLTMKNLRERLGSIRKARDKKL